MLLDEAAQHLHRHMRGDVRRVALDAEPLDLPGLAQALRQQARIGLLAERFEQAVASFEHRERSLVAALRQPRGDHAALGGAAEMQPLDHPAGARLRKRQQPARERAGDAERVGGLRRRELHQRRAGRRRAERPGHARPVEADLLGRMQRRGADAEHHLDAGDDGGDEIAAAGAAGLRHRERRQRHGGAAMHAGAGHRANCRARRRARRCRAPAPPAGHEGDGRRRPAAGTGRPAPLAIASASTICDQGNRWP